MNQEGRAAVDVNGSSPIEHHSPEVLIFQCSTTGATGKYGPLSNYYLLEKPFKYRIAFGHMKGTVITCKHSNKPLHCTKASVFNDPENFAEINSQDENPGNCQKLGRACKGFNQGIWDEKVNDVIDDILFQKFSSDSALTKLLLSTGDAFLGNANTNKDWGIGLTPDDPDVMNMECWTCDNIQGKSLMRVREKLRKAPHEQQSRKQQIDKCKLISAAAVAVVALALAVKR
mmetsp:Transcript_98427/g.170491  ORF Transcript_98427/g.170491 Transcript_98427/m.170491 type:complete len:230 (-) Transcript_98427:147-836(-)